MAAISRFAAGSACCCNRCSQKRKASTSGQMADARSFAILDQLVTLQSTKFRPPPAASETMARGGRDR
eukprot:3824363-Pyramimonas_sp.AAC.1